MFFFTPLIWELNFEPKASFILRMLCTTELNPQISAKWLWLHKISIHIVIATLYIFAFSLFFENSTENMVNFDHTPPPGLSSISCQTALKLHPLPEQKEDQKGCQSLSSGHEMTPALKNPQKLYLPVQDQARQHPNMDGVQFLLKPILC